MNRTYTKRASGARVGYLILCAGLSVFSMLVQAHTDDDADDGAKRTLNPEEQAVVTTLEAFARAFQATDIDAIRELTLSDGAFSHFEGTFADWNWSSYAGHLQEEMPSFSETRYRLWNIRPEVVGEMAFCNL